MNAFSADRRTSWEWRKLAALAAIAEAEKAIALDPNFDLGYFYVGM